MKQISNGPACPLGLLSAECDRSRLVGVKVVGAAAPHLTHEPKEGGRICRQRRVEPSWATATSLGTQRVIATKFLCAYCTLCVRGYQTGSDRCTVYMTHAGEGQGGGTSPAMSLGGKLHRYTRDMLGMLLCAHTTSA